MSNSASKDVINFTVSRKDALICSCGGDEYGSGYPALTVIYQVRDGYFVCVLHLNFICHNNPVSQKFVKIVTTCNLLIYVHGHGFSLLFVKLGTITLKL